jgi:predicted nuclease with RNAse H fold
MQDVVNLKAIVEIAYERLRRKVLPYRSKWRLETARKKVDIVPSKWAKPFLIYEGKQNRNQIVPDLLAAVGGNGRLPRIVGIDLCGSARRASGWAMLSGDQAITKRLATDKEILEETLQAKPDLVSIDSPLSLPEGYPNHQTIYRQCELTLKRMGISVFWCLLPSMRTLTMRGIRLARKLRANGIRVIESYPGAAQDVLLIPRKKASTEELKWGLIHAGFKGDWIEQKISHDELDAITSGLVGIFYLAKRYWALGNPNEDYLIIPWTPQLSIDKIHHLTGTNILGANGTHTAGSDVPPSLGLI